MNQLGAVLAARAHRDGHAYRSASVRHRRLVARPLAIVLQQLGAEPFTAAALGFGRAPDALHTIVAGEPRNRDLAFAALLTFARWFNRAFEAPGARRERVTRGTYTFERAVTLPQLVVPNRASLELLGRLGRRLAYLPTDGPRPADLALVLLGRHLQFVARHAAWPGQQLVIVLTDLLAAHWTTAQSDFERQSLAALDAYIDPAGSPAWDWELRASGRRPSRAWRTRRARAHGFEAAVLAERFAIGPVPDADDDTRLEPLMQGFNAARAGRTTPAVVRALLPPIAAHYQPLLERAWELLWHALERERAWPEAPSVTRRWDEDRDAYTQHLDWSLGGGRTRTRHTPRQAAMTLRRLEGASARLVAEEACDDPLRMIPFILDHKALEGRVAGIDLTHYEVARVRPVLRPLLTLISPDPCVMPRGRELWWSAHPTGALWVVEHVAPGPGSGSTVTLKLTTSTLDALPSVGSDACFSIHTTDSHWLQQLPYDAPWTHRPVAPPVVPAPIEEDAA